MNAELLSRIAETIYWTGRYVERAEGTARILDVIVYQENVFHVFQRTPSLRDRL